MNNIRVRFAPSPTGFLHIGSLRTVLFDYLIAKSLNGKLILRIEDTDQKREIEGAVDGLINILDWVGLKFDEGPHIGGNYGPYVQTERLKIYQKYLQELLQKDGAYHCFCSPERLEAMRQEQAANKMPPRYDRTCRDLAHEEVERRISNGEQFVIRQKMPLSGEITVVDELKGKIKFKLSDLDDQVLIKSNGIPTYQFASVVDDHTMEISHVLRGDEWISSLPKNILLYQAFGWQPPKFIHMPLTLNKEGGKLSKRQGDVAVEDYKDKGYLPEALLNFSVLQSWSPSASAKTPADKKDEILTLDEMVAWFDYHDMGTSPSIFEIDKLDYFNGYYIRQKSIESLTEMSIPYLVKDGMIIIQNERYFNNLNKSEITLDFVFKAIKTAQDRMKKISDVSELVKFYFVDELEYPKELLIWKTNTNDQTAANLKSVCKALNNIDGLSWNKENIEKEILQFIQSVGGKNGDYLWPLRVALTGLQNSPGPFEVAGVLGKDRSLKRVNFAIEKISK